MSYIRKHPTYHIKVVFIRTVVFSCHIYICLYNVKLTSCHHVDQKGDYSRPTDNALQGDVTQYNRSYTNWLRETTRT